MARHISERKTTMAVVVSARIGDLVLTVAPEGVYYREKGRRKRFLMPHGLAYQHAVKLHVIAEAAERQQRRKRGRR